MERTKVFVVDDDPDCSRLVQIILEKTGSFDVKIANGPRGALAAAREFMPDVFVLDVDMPEKDGGQLSHEIKTDAALHDVPILFLTGLIREEETRGGSALRGGNRFLSKPPAPLALIATIESLLSEAASARQGASRQARSQ